MSLIDMCSLRIAALSTSTRAYRGIFFVKHMKVHTVRAGPGTELTEEENLPEAFERKRLPSEKFMLCSQNYAPLLRLFIYFEVNSLIQASRKRNTGLA